MPVPTLHVLLVVGSLRENSITRVVLNAAPPLRDGCQTDLLDLAPNRCRSTTRTPLRRPGLCRLKRRIEQATCSCSAHRLPRQHQQPMRTSWTISGTSSPEALRHAGRLAQKGSPRRTNCAQSPPVQRLVLPYAVSFMDHTDVRDGQIVSPSSTTASPCWCATRAFTALAGAATSADLHGDEPGFLAPAPACGLNRLLDSRGWATRRPSPVLSVDAERVPQLSSLTTRARERQTRGRGALRARTERELLQRLQRQAAGLSLRSWAVARRGLGLVGPAASPSSRWRCRCSGP